MSRAWHGRKKWVTLPLVVIICWGLAIGAWSQQQAVAQIGNALIGKVEGPEVITDPARFPTTFNEAPQLAELVKAGKLPPVADPYWAGPLVIQARARNWQVWRYLAPWLHGTGRLREWLPLLFRH